MINYEINMSRKLYKSVKKSILFSINHIDLRQSRESADCNYEYIKESIKAS